MRCDNGSFIISLDFELIWGVLDSKGDDYFSQICNVHKVVPRLLNVFEKYEISCTWATVGALLVGDVEAFNRFAPDSTPSYDNREINPYERLSYIYGLENRLYSANSLVRDIISRNKQELASHTFSHYYCLEPGQDVHDFREDVKSNIKLALDLGVSLNSMVFPRNQFDQSYLNVLSSLGFTSYRGNPAHWAYEPAKGDDQGNFKRLFRLIDNYIPLSGHLTSIPEKCNQSGLINVPASLFLRPYNPRLKWLDGLRLLRIKRSMTKAAKTGRVFHLWWHPHNFGSYTEENMMFLVEIIQHYRYLHEEYGFESVTMSEIAKRC
ncbi:TPA: hypothetical protein I7745_19305 [Vibrio vulnificus]|nr:hypothetical protein [Vibrio vulnificus]